MAEPIRVTMLGSFSIRRGDACIDDSSNRMRKVWLLLAYMIHNRRRWPTQAQYMSLIQGTDSTEPEDPVGRMKALFFRTRTLLDSLGKGTGHELILRRSGSYVWNTDVPLELDAEEFERLCTAAGKAENGDDALALYLQALALYQGDFLPRLSMEPWVMPIHTYYHQLFLDAVLKTLPLLQERNRWEEANGLCDRALKIEPYSEELYRHLMLCRIALDDRAGAAAAFEQMSELLFETFGVMPSDESRRIYREATREVNDRTVPIDAVREQLKENAEVKSAVYCEYDFFRLLYQVQARALARSGDVVHIALLSLHGEGREALPRRSLDRAMENLKELLLTNLRQGDVVSRCSISQMVVMLPQANYENSCAVCQRIIRAFQRQYPHSPAAIHFSVQPLEPTKF